MNNRRFSARVQLAPGFGAKLRELRDCKGLTQNELAARIGVKREQITYYELGSIRPLAERVVELDRALGAGGDLMRYFVAGEIKRLAELLETFR